MKQRFILFRRKDTYYCENTATGKQTSLRTKDETVALALLNARNESIRQPVLNLALARTYLTASDPKIVTRTWLQALDDYTAPKTGTNRERWIAVRRAKPLAPLLSRVLLETQPEHMLAVLRAGTVSTNLQLRTLHNYCLDMGWLPWPILKKRQWPAIEYKEKRAITADEHQAILATVKKTELRKYLEALWLFGGSQSDMANLSADNVDWTERVITYARQKTKSVARLHFGEKAASLLKQLPQEGKLFPKLSQIHERERANYFRRLCRKLGIFGVTLHSYRYAWAERARINGFPERFAQEALGHNSKSVHRAYARNAHVVIPTLEDYEKKGDAPLLHMPAIAA